MKTNNMAVDLNGLILSNPIVMASGTYGFGREYAELIDLNEIGAISVKGLTLEPREGNEGRRIVETPMGMINSVGLQNPGVHYFIENEIQFLRQFNTKIIANINGNTIEEYCEIASILDQEDVDSIELNISCPNVKNGGLAFGTDPEMVKKIVDEVRKSTSKHLIVKLSPNVTDIKPIAKAAEENGADCLSLINTFAGMSIDIHSRRPFLRRVTGGVSGPAIKPMALKMVYEVAQNAKIPVIGMGGIATAEDAIEFLLAGAQAVGIGTANFYDPRTPLNIKKGIQSYMAEYGLEEINAVINGIRL